MKEIKTVSLIGLGAIGCYMAENLVKAVGYDNFRVIADGKRKERIENEGIIINGVLNNFRVVTPEEKTNPADLVIVITKMMQLESALQDIKNQIGDNTIIMSLLNGVESEEIVANVYGEDKMLYTVTRAAVTKVGNVVTYNPKISCLEFGEKKNEVISERVKAISDLFNKSGIKYKIPKDMIRAIWRKFMCNVSENQSSAILGIPFGAWHSNEHANYVREAAMNEVLEIAQKLGIDLSINDILDQREVLKKINPNARTSLLQDIEAGRKTEVEMFSGTIMNLGSKLGISTPVNNLFYHMIKTLEDKNEGAFNYS